MNFNIPFRRNNETRSLNCYLVYRDIKYRSVYLEKYYNHIEIIGLLRKGNDASYEHKHYFATVIRNTFYFRRMPISH